MKRKIAIPAAVKDIYDRQEYYRTVKYYESAYDNDPIVTIRAERMMAAYRATPTPMETVINKIQAAIAEKAGDSYINKTFTGTFITSYDNQYEVFINNRGEYSLCSPKHSKRKTRNIDELVRLIVC